MNWFKRKNRKSGDQETDRIPGSPDNRIPGTVRSADLFRLVTPVFLALFRGILLIRAGVLQSAPAAVVLALVVLGIGMRSGMLVFGVADKIVVEQHDDNNQTKCAHDAQHNNHGLSVMMMRMVTWNSEEPDRENKNQNTDHEEQEAVHDYSTPLLSVVAMIKAAAKIINPTTKILNRKVSPEISWPMTKAARNNFPMSYNALANSLRCVFSRLITCLNIIYSTVTVKGNMGTVRAQFLWKG